MAWARLDDRWHDHPKVVEAGMEAAGLWVMCLTWANHNRRKSAAPGFVPAAVVARFAGSKASRLSKKLVAVRLFDPAEGGWMIHDFTVYLPKYDSAKAAEAGRAGAESRWGNHPDEPPPDGEPPSNPDSKPPSDCQANGHRTGSEPMATRADAAASARRNPVPIPPGADLGDPGASVDAQEPNEPEQSQRTAAQRLTARYAAGVRLADAGRAVRTLGDALGDGISERLLEGAVDVLIAEQGECTRGRLRVALLKAEGNWGPAGSAGGPSRPGNPYLDDLRSRGTGTDSFRALFAVPDPNTTPALEAR